MSLSHAARCLPLLAAILGGGAGCEEEPAPPQSVLDRDAYGRSAAMLASDPAQAAELCFTIDNAVLEGECAMFAAKELAGRRLDPLPTCARVRHEAWQQVCYFEASDAAGLIGETAIAACQRSGAFIERCLSHALSRHADREWRQVPPGQEGAFLAFLDAQIPAYGLENGHQDVHRDFLARRIADRLRKSAPGGVPARFSAQDCGQAPAATCAEAYRYLVRGAARDRDVSALCAAPATPERVAQAGLPPWPDGDPAVVDELWRRMCRELQGAGRPPPHLPPR